MKTTTAIALFISALFVGGTAMAAGEQDPVMGGSQTQAGAKTEGGDFTKLDANHDGRISKSEASADSKLKSDFDKLDRNKDGQLSAEEYGKVGGVKEESK